MWKRLKCCAILLWFLLFSFENSSFRVCGDDGVAATSSRNGKRQSMIPLRDNTDYEQSENGEYDPEYEDEYETFDGEEFPDGIEQDNDVQPKIQFKAKNVNEDVSNEHLVDSQRIQTEMPTTVISLTSAIGSTAIEMCPKECSCLNDFMDCIRLNLDQLPHVPQWVSSL